MLGALLLATRMVATAPGCDGLIVHAIDVQVNRPDFAGASGRWRAAARSLGLHHASTQPAVIRAFLALHVGQPCTERRRLESERMLRAQSFIGDAEVTATPDSAGGVIVMVVTRDEIPVLAAARFHGAGWPQAARLGNENIGGAGILGEARYEQPNGYRAGLGARLVAATTFGHPYRFTADGERSRLGHFVTTSFDHPLFTDLQHVAWHTAYVNRDDYLGIRRSADDDVALEVQQERLEADGILRAFGQRTISIIGLGAARLHVAPADTAVLVSDHGLLPDTGTALRNRYQAFSGTRIGPIAGLQRVRYTAVTGFDALYATQDVMSGFRLGIFAARDLAHAGDANNFVSGAAYAGAASTRVLLAAAAEIEASRGSSRSQWDGVVASGRAALYMKAGPNGLLTIANELSATSRSRLPAQLSIGDWEGGLRGYARSTLSGAMRDVTRAEMRVSRPAAIHRADVGVAAFFETATLRAGDAPYGTSTRRSAAGLSLLTAYPARAKRTARVDIAVPLQRAGAGVAVHAFELRFTMVDRTAHFWTEPGDVARARTGSTPSSFFGWPNP